MLRLIQGDVGSGKTAVAAYALALAAAAGVQGALLAPTDLLARQHAPTLDDLLRPLGIPVELLTGSLSAAASAPGRSTRSATAGRRSVVGTHALFSERVRVPAAWAWSSSTSSTASASSSAARWRRRRPAAPPTSCS